MYKLTVVAGPNRGNSFAVQDGETSIGRQTGNNIQLPSAKVSKRHCVLVVSNGEVLVKDQGSSNGTFVNGALAKQKKIKSGDKISVGDYVLEFTRIASRPAPGAAPVLQLVPPPPPFPAIQGGAFPGAAPPQAGGGEMPSIHDQVPTDLKGKALWYFDRAVMPFFYGMAMKNEWRLILAGLFAALTFANLFVSVYPLVESNRQGLLRESGRRAQLIARQIVDRNSAYLAARAETRTEIGSLDREEGVQVAVLTDLGNRILAPSSRLGQYLASGDEATWGVRAKEGFAKGRETGYLAYSGDTAIAIEPVKVFDAQSARNVVAGMAIVSIDASLAMPGMGALGVVYSETLILTVLISGLIFLVVYRLTLKPFLVLNDDMDKVLKGDMAQVTHEFKIEELDPLWDVINSATQRISRSGGGGDAGGFGGGSGGGIDEVLSSLQMLGGMASFGVVVFDGDRKVQFMNSHFEEASGIRGDSAQGQEISAVARDQALGAFCNDLLERTQSGGNVAEDFDFSGISYKVHASAIGAFGAKPKAFLFLAQRNAEGG